MATYTKQQVDNAIGDVLTPKRVFAYMSIPANTECLTADEWYRLEGTFTNNVIDGFTADANGIVLTEDDDTFETEWGVCGNMNAATTVRIGLVKDATFDTNGKMTAGTFLEGSCGGYEAVALFADQFISPRSLWAGELETGDRISLVIQTTDANRTLTPISAVATIHKLR